MWFCLEVCPTFKLTGDENNSPRGRLRLWRQEAEGRLAPDSWTDFYTSECVGCLACETACPANVPYGEIFEHVRHAHVEQGRAKPSITIRLASRLIRSQGLLDLAALPVRLLRRLGLIKHPLAVPGHPAVFQSSAEYARDLMNRYQPDGPVVVLQTGCLMDSVFREINFATIRVLIHNNVQVIVPEEQTMLRSVCGTYRVTGLTELRQQHPHAFCRPGIDAVISNFVLWTRSGQINRWKSACA